jgi:hypothetical protein
VSHKTRMLVSDSVRRIFRGLVGLIASSGFILMATLSD